MWRCGPHALALLFELPSLNFQYLTVAILSEILSFYFTLKYTILYLMKLLLNYEVHEVHTLQRLHLHSSY